MAAVDYREILHYWFGELEEGYPTENKNKLWFSGAQEFDNEIRQRFSETIELAIDGDLSDWESSPKSLIALIITLDQLPRSLYRKTPAAFSGDLQARKVALDAIEKKWDLQLEFAERTFLYMPLMHSESLADQVLCLSKYQAMREEVPVQHKQTVQESIHFSEEHKKIIEEFGRFPHRNKFLGRTNTAEEEEYLKSGASSFGQ